MYEAAFLPEMWVPLLDDLAVGTGSAVGELGIVWPTPRGIRTSFEIASDWENWERPPDSLKTWKSYVRSANLINRGFLQLNPFQGDWSDMPGFQKRFQVHLARGYGVQAYTILELFNGEIVTLYFTRRPQDHHYAETTIDKLNQIYPAFRSSAFFASRLQFERARSGIDTLNDFGLPAALLNPLGHVLYSNNLFEGVDLYFQKLRTGQLSLRGGDNLRKAFSDTLALSATAGGTVPIPAEASRNGAVIHFMPTCRDARAIFAMNCTVMVVSPLAATLGVPGAELVSKLFGLTPSESRIAVGLASGLSLRDSAVKCEVTVGTARSYLIRIFAKTGTNQQSELVSLLKGIVAGKETNRDTLL